MSNQPALTKIEGKTFTEVTVNLDGIEYVNCTFTRCRFIYHGAPARISGGYVSAECVFDLQDAAAYVVTVLHDLGWTVQPR